MMKVSLVAGYADTEQGMFIGRNNTLPWPTQKADVNFFKKLTTGHIVMMGRKTWDSIPDKFRPLPDRTNIVLTSQMEKIPKHQAIAVDSLTSAFIIAEEISRLDKSDLFIIGGGKVYSLCVDYRITEDMYLTRIDVDTGEEQEHDVYFPRFNEEEWKMTITQTEGNCEFRHYTRL